jgi:hypothetical protein
MIVRFIVCKGISRPKMPRAGAFLRKPGPGLKLTGAIGDAFISPVLSLHQLFGGSLLKQAGSLKTDGACVAMAANILDHGMPMRRLGWLFGPLDMVKADWEPC